MIVCFILIDDDNTKDKVLMNIKCNGAGLLDINIFDSQIALISVIGLYIITIFTGTIRVCCCNRRRSATVIAQNRNIITGK